MLFKVHNNQDVIDIGHYQQSVTFQDIFWIPDEIWRKLSIVLILQRLAGVRTTPRIT